ncbi:MAG: hypothetical protein H6733_07510 [Alphaproteobacteria bacterium]|nr:hypothetical protein [Alphaproteobacteria bacterium]
MLRPSLVTGLLAALLAVPASTAHAQETFSLDAVVVTTFETDDPGLRADADALRALLERRLATDHVVLPMAEVPPFRAYGADVYLQACPAGQYPDCAFVVGQRAQADWVIAGQLHAATGALVVTLSFIRVADALLLVQVDVPFGGADDTAVADQVGAMFDGLIAGEATTVDLRLDADRALAEDDVDPVTVEAAAAELEALESEQGEAERGARHRGRARRLTRADLARYEDSEATAPWVPLGMTEGAWLRFQHSGLSLPDWRYRQRGHFGELTLGASALTLQQGPWTQVYEGWYAIDGFDLQLADQYVMHDLAPGLLRSWELSLSGGVLPWLDVGVYGGPRVTTYRWRVQRVVEGDEPVIKEPADKAVTTWHVGGRLLFAPMPTFPARPTVTVGMHGWWGTRREDAVEVSEDLESLPRSFLLLLHLAPGMEVDLGRYVRLWARADVEVPVIRRVADPARLGGALLPTTPTPDATDESVSVGGSIGLTLRLRLRPKLRTWPGGPRVGTDGGARGLPSRNGAR